MSEIQEDDQFVIIRTRLKIAGVPVDFEIPTPVAPVQPIDLLPILQGITGAIVSLASQLTEKAGAKISCKPHCGACCRQLVPISPTEARRLRDVVEEMPEPRRTEVTRRFTEARQRLEQSGLLDSLEHPERRSVEELRNLGQEYFQAQIPCPFLEEESCSIYEDRPLKCREYLVTSPAEECARPSAETIRMVPMPGIVSRSLLQIEEKPGDVYRRWVPLILLLEDNVVGSDDLPRRPGPEWLKEILLRFCNDRIPSSQASPFDSLN